MTYYRHLHHLPPAMSSTVPTVKSSQTYQNTALAAKEARLYSKLSRRLIECEERSKLMKKMKNEEIGFREEELFILSEMGKLRGTKKHLWKERKQLLALLMRRKLRDNISLERNLRKMRNQARRKLEDVLGPNSKACRKIVKNTKIEGMNVRQKCGMKNDRKLRFLKRKYGMRECGLNDLCEEDRVKYKDVKVFSGEEIQPEKMRDPIIVCRQGEEIQLNEDELSVLRLGPKFCEYTNLSDVDFEIEVEQTVLKYKWETMDEVNKQDDEESMNEEMKKFEDPSILARKILFEELFTKDELDAMKDDEEDRMMMMDAEMRAVFNLREGIIDMRKRRATDVKGNSRVILPKKMRGFETEAKLEMMRQELRGVFSKYTNEKCGSGGLQKSNLSRGEIKGLKSLKKRVKEGELTILPTDKTGLFAVMSRETYQECGLKHTVKDREIGWEDLKQAQSEINGHTSMVIKIFDIGRAWEHTSRIRETMLGETLATCPLSLLYKDHKGWTKDLGTVPPTRPVAGGHLGMNLHLSEVISDLVEPLVDKHKGGRKCISTEDLISKVVGTNNSNKEWTKGSWWEGQSHGGYIACGTCVGDWMNVFDLDDPELCSCVGAETMGETRVTAKWLKRLRRTKWEEDVKWDPRDMDRLWDSSEVLPEDLQDYQSRMVLMGFDVESLYPNLDINMVGDRVKEAVLTTDIIWDGINYMEAVRYIALNWSEEKCKSSKLRRVLPWRRKNHGTRPGVRGIGPKGPVVGDTEQWIFPRVVLTPEDKQEIIGTVLSIATTALFHHHYYSFGGRKYKQMGGGPIGLRGTCALARLIMQIFDVKWEQRLKELSIRIWLYCRYINDGRAALPPLKPTKQLKMNFQKSNEV